jgi:hypothetical protein
MFEYSLCCLILVSMINFSWDPFFNFFFFSFLLYHFYHYTEKKFSQETSFNSLSTNHKTYVVANVVKGSVLFYLCFVTLSVLPFIFEKTWTNEQVRTIKNLGAIYTSLDFSALSYNKKMAGSTIVHHICVVLFFLISYIDSFSINSITRLIMFYAIFSSTAFYVNFLLGLRYCFTICAFFYRLSFLVFFTTTMMNWFIQLLYISVIPYPKIYLLFYIGLLCFIAHDDVILLQWLKNHG